MAREDLALGAFAFAGWFVAGWWLLFDVVCAYVVVSSSSLSACCCSYVPKYKGIYLMYLYNSIYT